MFNPLDRLVLFIVGFNKKADWKKNVLRKVLCYYIMLHYISGPKIQQCEEKLTQLIGDIFIGNEMVPDIIDKPPLYPLDLTYRYLLITVCPRSLDPFLIVSYHINWVKTSWTYSIDLTL